MSTKGTVIAVVIAAGLLWCLSGLYHMVLVADMEKESYMMFQSVMHPEGSMPNVAFWIIPLAVVQWFVLWIMTRGTAAPAVAAGAKVGALVGFVLSMYVEWAFHMWFAGVSMGMSAMGIGWETIQGAIGGALMAWLYTRFGK